MRLTTWVAFSAAGAGSMLLTGCPVDDRELKPIDVQIVGKSGRAGQGGEAGGDAGAGTESGGTAGSLGGSGSGGKDGGNGGVASAGRGGSNEPPPRCPDIDSNDVLDCEETLAKNASFDEDVSDWITESGAKSSWEETDGHGVAPSGALGLTLEQVTEQNGSLMLGARQCFSATGATVYHYAVQASIPQELSGVRAGFQLITYDGPSCTGDPVDSLLSNFIDDSTWDVAQLTYLTAGSVKSASLRLVGVKPFSMPPVTVLFDNVLVRLD